VAEAAGRGFTAFRGSRGRSLRAAQDVRRAARRHQRNRAC
jgi:hypothetical protein